MIRSIALALALSVAVGCGATHATGSGPGPSPDALPGASGDAASGAPVAGCDGAQLLANPPDLAAPGPWPVGARTVTVHGLTTEVWYPAAPGSAAGMAAARYDIRTELPASEAAKIPDADNPWAPCDCYRDLPLDTAHGPYPVIVFVHGTASFRFQSLHFMTHWASRGFVVVAADHPGLRLGDILAQACGGTAPAQDLSGNLDALIAAIASPAGDLGFLAGHLDSTRIAIAGHSAGGGAAAAASGKPGVQVVIVMAGAQATAAASGLRSTLYLGGLADSIASWNTVKTAWSGSPTPRRLAGIANGGHLTFSDLCQVENAAGEDLLQIANDHMVCGANLAGFLFDCSPSHIDGPTGWSIVDYATSAVLEPVLQCKPQSDLHQLTTIYPAVTDYEEAL